MPQSRVRDTMQTSRGKFDNLHCTPAEFTALDFDGYGLCCLMPTRPARTASYPVSVRQVTALLHASLEPCLTAALLRFANTSPPSGCVEDFHLQVIKHARHTKKTAVPAKGTTVCNLPQNLNLRKPPVPLEIRARTFGLQSRNMFQIARTPKTHY